MGASCALFWGKINNCLFLAECLSCALLKQVIGVCMWKIRVLAALISLVLTGLMLLILPRVYFGYVNWAQDLTPQQQAWFHWGQVVLGVLFALWGAWQWRRNKAKK